MARFWHLAVCPSHAHVSPCVHPRDSKANDKMVKIWSPFTGELIRNLNGHTKGLSDIAWSSDSANLASASDDHTVRIWEVDTVRVPVHVTLCTSPLKHGSVGLDAKGPERAYKLRLLCELQQRFQSARLWRMRLRDQDMERRER